MNSNYQRLNNSTAPLPWLRQPGESEQDYRAFQAYISAICKANFSPGIPDLPDGPCFEVLNLDTSPSRTFYQHQWAARAGELFAFYANYLFEMFGTLQTYPSIILPDGFIQIPNSANRN
jgi:hypothetical protein